MAGQEATWDPQERWQSLFPDQPPAALQDSYQRLRLRYDEPHRAYHTFEHVKACLNHLDQHRDQLQDARAVELALWYHDVIYNPRASDNEARSADFAVDELTRLGEPITTIERVKRLIEVTEHPSIPRDDDEALLLDIDLAILGAPANMYQRYEDQVRQEYRWVPGPLYRRGRKKVLAAFLAAPSIYHSPPFQTQREAQARDNLIRAREQLTKR
ncbi:N-methyl-D-aspartate receptor NMDAR2C subunit [Marinobacter sp. LN3S78]|uniref:HD domain-containing protein n=1 Tax=Marinobacter sp. LN3S78 TaxID=3382300 RepID=UPI00387B446E